VFGRRKRQRPSDGDRVGSALRVARGWLANFDGSGDVADLDEAVAAGARALALCADDAPERFAALLVLGEARSLRSEATGSTEDLDGSVEVYREVVRLAPTEQPDMTGFALRAFAVCSLRLGVLTGTLRPVEQAVLATRELDEFASFSGSVELHSTAAELLEAALVLLPPDHPSRAPMSALRAGALIRWMKRTGERSRLGDAEEEAERALRLCPPDDPNRLPFLAILGDVRRLRYEDEGTLDALDTFLDAERNVLDHYPAGHQVSTTMLHNIGLLYRDRYRLAGDVADLDNAAHHLRLAIDRAPGPRSRANSEKALAEVAELRGPRPPTTVDLLASHIPPGTRAEILVGPGSTPHRPAAETGDDLAELVRHHNALIDLMQEFERTGDGALLDRIRADGRVLLVRLPAGHPHRWLIGMPLGLALMRRFEAHGEAADLDEAVQLLQEAVQCPMRHPIEVVRDLPYLAWALLDRFRRDHSGADLDEAIALCRRGVEETSEGDQARGRCLSVLGTALIYRFEHHGRRFDLDEAIEVGQAALAAADTPADTALARANLGNRLRKRFEVGDDPADLDVALVHLRAALAVADRPSDRLILALTLSDRGTGLGDSDDLLDAVIQFRAVLAATPERSLFHLSAQLGLARVLANIGRTDEAIAVLAGVAERGPGRSFNRMEALALLAELRADRAAAGADDWSPAVEAFADAVEQLHLTVWRGLAAVDWRRLVTRWSRVACDAAAAAVAAGKPERAVELLDHGRALWWGQVLDTRTDLTALREAHRELADRLTALSVRLDDGSAERRRRLAEEWDDIVAAVRTRPGFDHFLQPTPFAELRDAAADGPVVLINVSRYRCDALVVTTDGVRVVPLPGLTVDQARDRTRTYLGAAARVGVGGTSSGPREQAILAYLEWLWDVVAEPVFAAVPVSAGTRLWWCPTGPLALAPLHAAGYHDPDGSPAGRAVLDRVVSSTTPTLRLLRHARRLSPVNGQRLLVVACDQRPDYVTGLPDLPSAAREAELLRVRLAGATSLTGASATKARVTDMLAEYTCVHFACHGDTQVAGETALFLADAPLTMTDIAQLDLGHAHLAVLSACHSAMGGTDWPDEATHLAAALQIAGFRQVVSTMWAISDDTAAIVANDLYRGLTAPKGTLDPSQTAYALHTVTHELRRRTPFQPSKWAPFVHFGQ
jgi:tetratricopeptide (TPR) repeat protein